MTNALAYYETELIMAFKRFVSATNALTYFDTTLFTVLVRLLEVTYTLAYCDIELILVVNWRLHSDKHTSILI